MRIIYHTLFITLVSITLFACGSYYLSTQQPEQRFNVIPKPVEVEMESEHFVMDSKTSISYEFEGINSTLFSELLHKAALPYFGEDYHFENKKARKNVIRFRKSHDTLSEEAYRLSINNKEICIEATTEHGLFYGLQTLIQLFPQENAVEGVKSYTFHGMKIKDEPRLAYRGMHIDVSRHFVTLDFLHKMVDALAFYKMNNLHLHLTDAAGWRLEIKKYPLLTEVAAYRTAENWKVWWKEGGRKYAKKGDSDAHGGYYTQEEMKELVAYATLKHINIIPEIEMPGHSEEVLAVYPELSCAGEPYKNSDFCIGNEQTFTFVEDVLSEVLEIFPSKYIHIGGDEAGKSGWKKCAKCAKRMKEEQLANVDELQSYMIRRVEQFLISKNRKLLGWDEILEGGLAPEATVMSWRGEEGGIKAAEEGHDAIMTPGKYCYFDAYQAAPETQPEAIGGYLPVKKVYSYDPAPPTMKPEVAKHIIGIQGCAWSEYMPNERHVEYMIFPRILAIAETGWTPQALRTWDNFKPRLNNHLPTLRAMNINCFPLSYEIDVTSGVDYDKQVVTLELDAEKYPAEIRYTTDGSLPTASSPIYKGNMEVKDSIRLKAAIFVNGKIEQPISEKSLDYHRAINKPITYVRKNFGGYTAGGDLALVDGLRGGFTYQDGRWQGLLVDLDVMIDMGEVIDIHQVKANFMQIIGPGVYFPTYVRVEISEDGKNFTEVCRDNNPVSPDLEGVWFRDFGFDGKAKGRYIRYVAKKHNGFIFIDEIRVW